MFRTTSAAYAVITASKRFAIDLILRVALFIGVVIGGTVLFMIVAELVGYLPYSDSPGPGWVGIPSFAEVEHVVSFGLGFGVICVPTTAIYGSLLFLIVRAMESVHIWRWLVVTVAALAAGFLSQFIIGGVGWLIAIGAVPVIVAAALGLIYGAFLLPARMPRAAATLQEES